MYLEKFENSVLISKEGRKKQTGVISPPPPFGGGGGV